MKKIAIFGSSGFAREVADLCDDQGYQQIVFLAHDVEQEDELVGLKLLPEHHVEQLHADGFQFAMGMGDSKLREALFSRYEQLVYPNLIHSSVIMGRQQREGFSNAFGNIVTAGCIFTNSITPGNFGIYNLKTTVGHDVEIGDYVSIMPNVSISGNVKICEHVFIGVSATILQGKEHRKLNIAEQAVVGAHSLVTKSVLANTTVFGVPAKKIRS